MKTVYVSIGNSDDKLTQADWSGFYDATDTAIRQVARRVHGAWVSVPIHSWQNACWCFEVDTDPDVDYCDRRRLRAQLKDLARAFGQDSIAWAEAPETEFLCAG